MTIDADALISGPRGRRAALAVATGANVDQELTATLLGWIMDLAYDLDPSAGTSRRYVRFGGVGSPEPEPSPFGDEDQLAAALLNEPILAELINPLEALEVSVNSARYWQEPEGEDFLCARPTLRPALLRAADALLSRPATQWWDAVVDRSDQWAVDFDYAGAEAGNTIRPDVRTFRARALAEEERARIDRPSDPTESISGSWWSTPLVPLASFSTTRRLGEDGPVGLHLVEDSMGWADARATPVRIDSSARVYEISDADDWAELCRRFPLEVTASRRHDWYRTTGRIGDWVIPDWSAVGEQFDGVHLSAAAYLLAAGVPISVDGESASLIAGWNPDETWWFRPEAIEVRDDASVSWRRGRDSVWRPITL